MAAANSLLDIPCPDMRSGIEGGALGPEHRFLVYGGLTGWVGQKVVAMLSRGGYEVKGTQTRLENREAIAKELDEYKPTRIINCAGCTGKPNVSWCDHNKEQTVRANVIGCLTLVDVAHLRGIHVTNLTTGCIYSYNGAFSATKENSDGWNVSDVFSEADDPNFQGSWYSRTKSYVDRILFHSYPNVLSFRLRMPISDDLYKKNFVTKIKNYAKIINVPNSMSVLYDLLPLLAKMADQKYTGLYNFTNPGVISHNQVLDYFKEILEPTLTYTNFSQKEHDEHVKIPRSNNMLTTDKLEKAAKELGMALPDIHTAVKASFERMKKDGQVFEVLKRKNDGAGEPAAKRVKTDE